MDKFWRNSEPHPDTFFYVSESVSGFASRQIQLNFFIDDDSVDIETCVGCISFNVGSGYFGNIFQTLFSKETHVQISQTVVGEVWWKFAMKPGQIQKGFFIFYFYFWEGVGL